MTQMTIMRYRSNSVLVKPLGSRAGFCSRFLPVRREIFFCRVQAHVETVIVVPLSEGSNALLPTTYHSSPQVWGAGPDQRAAGLTEAFLGLQEPRPHPSCRDSSHHCPAAWVSRVWGAQKRSLMCSTKSVNLCFRPQIR